MEEDIELVEEFINICEINFKFYEQPNVVIISDTVEAIKNLINRNKELEKVELEHQKINGNLREKIKELEDKNRAIKNESDAYAQRMINLYNELQCEKEHSKYEWIRQNCLPQGLVNKLYIPKSKIKEKIEEINSRIEKYREYAEQGIETDVEWVDNVADRETIQVLQELLEE